MALTLEQFLDCTNAEIVGGQLIVGQLAERRMVGDLNSGVLVLNEEGEKLVADIEDRGVKAAAKAAKAERDAAAAEQAALEAEQARQAELVAAQTAADAARAAAAGQ